ncbi:MAG: 16S rRNA (cytosine(1402)-N(4))-methyltransferase RsmH [Alphaproteobacteria bacterium]|nr:16S rRNA (cytosine(1402)-N(4))-methyltransferase RsmH [Alphaproteobacteria bacterium]
MRDEIVAMTAPKDGEIFIDGTFGAGGYSRALLEAADCRVLAIDRDPAVQAIAAGFAAEFPGRFYLLPGQFSHMVSLAESHGVTSVNGVLLDIGLSSMQVDTAERGFSFQQDGPLDMRMGDQELRACEVVNDYDEGRLADIIYHYGEEKKSRAIARAIVTARAKVPLSHTLQLATIIEQAIGYRRYVRGKKQIHPATRTFQALRIHVNDELGELARGLSAAEYILAPGGRLSVVSFHSLEDRIVKKFLKKRSGNMARGSRHLPQAIDRSQTGDVAPSFTMVSGGVIKASAREIKHNIRSRSAKLRGGVRTAAAPWPQADTGEVK